MVESVIRARLTASISYVNYTNLTLSSFLNIQLHFSLHTSHFTIPLHPLGPHPSTITQAKQPTQRNTEKERKTNPLSFSIFHFTPQFQNIYVYVIPPSFRHLTLFFSFLFFFSIFTLLACCFRGYTLSYTLANTTCTLQPVSFHLQQPINRSLLLRSKFQVSAFFHSSNTSCPK